jgi:hypothetical protein
LRDEAVGVDAGRAELGDPGGEAALRVVLDRLAERAVGLGRGVAVVTHDGCQLELGAADHGERVGQLLRRAQARQLEPGLELERDLERAARARGAAREVLEQLEAVDEDPDAVRGARRRAGEEAVELRRARRVAHQQVGARGRGGEDRVDAAQVEHHPARLGQAAERVGDELRRLERLQRRPHRPALGARDVEGDREVRVEGGEVEERQPVAAAGLARELGEPRRRGRPAAVAERRQGRVRRARPSASRARAACPRGVAGKGGGSRGGRAGREEPAAAEPAGAHPRLRAERGRTAQASHPRLRRAGGTTRRVRCAACPTCARARSGGASSGAARRDATDGASSERARSAHPATMSRQSTPPSDHADRYFSTRRAGDAS